MVYIVLGIACYSIMADGPSLRKSGHTRDFWVLFALLSVAVLLFILLNSRMLTESPLAAIKWAVKPMADWLNRLLE
ncbi:hypothetical protein [Paenibacillus cremeus]|uniref:Uncharacterized protein n=1 Tax=Paenibacillus cremeus TaxID=2163881 RepID=A0A559KA46_9BACL|nr:hypothetical protein [Paenibacillus cremeus]TVY09007.1 hypothetical protein FPZ49_16120 [Paenibacillus cremeus]